ncbi:hypothetical protein ACHAXT_013320 [Thalassiosira profunda]
MSLSAFNALAFQRKVDDALRVVARTLELERKPRLASEVDHDYGAKYSLVNSTSNAAVIAYVNALEKLGLDAAALKAIDKSKAVTLRFEAETKSEFVEEKRVDVPVGRSYHETEEETKSGGEKVEKTTKTRVMKAVNHITEFHWDVEMKWRPSFSTELPLTWLLGQIDLEQLNSQFRVDVEDEETKTPRRNHAVDGAVDFASELGQWSKMIEWGFVDNMLGSLWACHNPALPRPAKTTTKQLMLVKDQYPIFNPILPLMEEGVSAGGEGGDAGEDGVECKSIVGVKSPDAKDDDQKVLLSSRDISKLLNEHIRTLDVAVSGVKSNWPFVDSDDILSAAEASLELLTCHLQDLSTMYTESMSYVESMLEEQLIAAIGKRLTPGDVDKFVKFHEARLLRPAPRPFSQAIRRPEHYPVGLLSIESQDGSNRESIHSHSREVEAASSLKIPLSAATVLELTGQQFIHGYMNHRFGESHKRHQLVARARQFSSFILVVGNMADGCTLQPKDAIIVQNKDELLIPLLLEEIPTAKEFKDAIRSLSPEQQRFARAFRKMQLASSVFGVCIIQIKPQLEALLGLPADALDKEMQLTQDLMELFVEHQVPSDLLSYDGFSEGVATADKISNVRANVKGVMDVINAEKAKQLKNEEAKTEMAVQKAFQRAANEEMEVLEDSAERPPIGEEVKREKNKAFDLLDALSRSGSLPIVYAELHVIVALTHCFDKDVMRTVISDNINPIEKLECSTLLLASAVHGVPARELIADVGELQRLEGTLPKLLGSSEGSENAGKSALLMSLGSGAVMGESSERRADEVATYEYDFEAQEEVVSKYNLKAEGDAEDEGTHHVSRALGRQEERQCDRYFLEMTCDGDTEAGETDMTSVEEVRAAKICKNECLNRGGRKCSWRWNAEGCTSPPKRGIQCTKPRELRIREEGHREVCGALDRKNMYNCLDGSQLCCTDSDMRTVTFANKDWGECRRTNRSNPGSPRPLNPREDSPAGSIKCTKPNPRRIEREGHEEVCNGFATRDNMYTCADGSKLCCTDSDLRRITFSNKDWGQCRITE